MLRLFFSAVVSVFVAVASPLAHAQAPAGSYFIYVSHAGSVSVIDGRTDTLVATIPVTQPHQGAHSAPQEKRLYVVLESTPEASSPEVAPFGTAARTARSALTATEKVAVVDLASNSVIQRVPTAERVWNVAASPDGAKLYVANAASNCLQVIDLKSRRELKRIAVGDGPWGVAVTPAPLKPGALTAAAE